jgi:hypothetical protein
LLASEEASSAERWNLSDVERLDSLGAVILWRAWGDRLPALLDADSHVRAMLDAVSVLGVACRDAAGPAVAARSIDRVRTRRLVAGASGTQVDRAHRPDPP